MPSHQNIPKIIHQIWLGPKPPPQQWLDSWKNKNPSWEYRLWTEKNIPKLKNQRQFNEITSYCGKADILRCELLYQYGGLYFDADSECLHSLDDSLLRYHFAAFYENEKMRPGLICQCVFGSEPFHPILKKFNDAVASIENLNADQPWILTGPLLFTKMIQEYQTEGNKVAVLPSHLFSPLHLTGDCYEGKGKIYGMQHWQSTKDAVKGPESILTEAFFTKLYQENKNAQQAPSSTLKNELKALLKSLKVKKLLDAACGEFNWMEELTQHLNWYLGIDIVPELILRNQKFYGEPRRYFDHSDLIRNRLPAADLTLCRDALPYFSFEDIQRALKNFKRSGSTYLLTTNFHISENRDTQTGEHRPINLQKTPFNFPQPLKEIQDLTDKNKVLALWKISDL
jgi:hypothetical protein